MVHGQLQDAARPTCFSILSIHGASQLIRILLAANGKLLGLLRRQDQRLEQGPYVVDF